MNKRLFVKLLQKPTQGQAESSSLRQINLPKSIFTIDSLTLPFGLEIMKLRPEFGNYA